MRLSRLAALPLAALLLGAVALPAAAQTDTRRFSGSMDVTVPTRTDRGSFDGTWFYVNRDAHIGMWIETVDGEPRLRLKYFGIGFAEGFETDWDGRASYVVPNGTGEFALTLTLRDRDVLEGDWLWDLRIGGSGRHERARVSMYRTDDGRQLAVHFQNFEHALRRGERSTIANAQKVWTFQKASNRQVRWEEIPF